MIIRGMTTDLKNLDMGLFLFTCALTHALRQAAAAAASFFISKSHHHWTLYVYL